MVGHIRQAIAIFVGLVLTDQLTKLIAHTLLEASGAVHFGPLAIVLVQGPEHLFSGLTTLTGEQPALGLGLIAVLLSLWAAERGAGWGGVPATGWLLVAAGLAGEWLDAALVGESTGVVSLQVGPVQVGFALSELLLLLGAAALVLAALDWISAPWRSPMPLIRASAVVPDMESFQRGIDNVHLDVRLSPRFCAATCGLVTAILAHEMTRNRHGERAAPPPGRRLFEEYRESYRQLLAPAIRAAKRANEPSRIGLLQFAVLKFLLEAVGREFEAQLIGLRAGLQRSAERHSPDQLTRYDHVFGVSKARRSIEQRTRKRLLDQLEVVESSTGTDLRESLFGEPWLLPRELLFNPLLQSDPNDDCLIMHRYVLTGRRAEERNTLSRFEQFVAGLYRGEGSATESLTDGDYVWLSSRNWNTCTEALGWSGGQMPAFGLWTDVGENIAILFDQDHAATAATEAELEGDRAGAARWRRQRRYQRRAAAQLEAFCRREGLLPRLVAGYEMVEVFDTHYEALNPLLVYQYLIGGRDRTNALRQIRRLAGSGERALPLAPLFTLARRVRRTPHRRIRQLMLRFARDFLAFRRDIRNYCIVQAILEQIRLLEQEEELRLSRVNRCLHEFLSEQEAPPTRERVRAHVVLKADLRGSTVVTTQLLERGLNPGTHFDGKFFAPINDVLRRFGAEKVFVEGDAVIATVLEYEDDPVTQTAVARACGVARRMLEVVQAHNRASVRQGLPELQVGIGIAFEPAPPSYIFEGDQPIMISPAISRADRLSSSSWQLREAENSEGVAVRVYELDPDHPMRGEKGQTDLRYNVNGVELESTGFDKLAGEIDLRPVPVDDTGRYLAGRCSDLQGERHLILLREGHIRRLGQAGPGSRTERVYYEVVSDPQRLEVAEQALRAGERDIAPARQKGS